MKKVKSIIWMIIILVGIIYYWDNYIRLQELKSGQICVQKLQKARNPITQQVKTFSTPCVMPKGWQPISN